MIPLKDDIPSRTFPFVTIGLIILNVLIFLYQISLGYTGEKTLIYKMGAIPYEIAHMTNVTPRDMVPVPFTLLTHMFMHGNFLHLLGNMLYLGIFGDNVEGFLGHGKFILFYLFCGIMAAIIHVFSDANSLIPMIGASGAIAGVLGSYFLLYPKANILTLIMFFVFIRVVRIPAFFFLGFWFLIQTLNIGSISHVAWHAHVGGFLCGLLLIAPIALKSRLQRH